MLPLIVFLALFALIVALIPKKFRYDVNPFRRWCNDCGQQQEQFTRSYNNHDVWWEDVGPTYKPNCTCHSYSTYKR